MQIFYFLPCPSVNEKLGQTESDWTSSRVENLLVVDGKKKGCGGEDLEEAGSHREERYLDMYTLEDEMVVIRGRLPQEVAAPLEKALEAARETARGH